MQDIFCLRPRFFFRKADQMNSRSSCSTATAPLVVTNFFMSLAPIVNLLLLAVWP